MKKFDKTVKFESKITDIESINPLFSKVKIRIAYYGCNRNGSYISKETFEKAIPTIFNCPIIGEYFEETDSFGDHGGKIVIDNKGIKFIATTKPYGIINENSEIGWEDITEEDGTVHNYFTATGYLWTGRYPELNQIIENSAEQSMEVDIVDGNWIIVDGKEYFNIDNMIFSGFCILGSAEPCFESASITAYQLDKDKFKEEFSLMMKELKFSLSNSKEQNKDGDKVKVYEKYSLTANDMWDLLQSACGKAKYTDGDYEWRKYWMRDYDETYVYTISETGEANIAFESAEEVVEKTSYVPVSQNSEDNENNFSRMINLFKSELISAKKIEKNYSEQIEGLEKEKEVFAKEKQELTNQVMSLTSEKEEFVKDKESFTVQLQEKDSEIAEAKEKYTKLEEEKEALVNYKLNKEIEEKKTIVDSYIEEFSKKVSVEELETYREKAMDMDLEEWVKEVKLFVFDKTNPALTFSAKPKHIKMGIIPDTNFSSTKEEKDIWERNKEKIKKEV